MKRICRRPEIQCCVVDDHCDIVPFVLELQRLCLSLGISHFNALNVHIDAHPDLSIPSSSTSTAIEDWNDVDKLFDILLEEEGGIAEFIIPLVHHHTFSQILWVRSPWANQLPDGTATFNVSRSPVRVDYLTPYYLDENASCETISNPAFQMHVTTCKATDRIDWEQYDSSTDDSKASFSRKIKLYENMKSSFWVLDICLDYFTTHNPFRVELLEMLKADDFCSDEERNDIVSAIVWLLSSMQYRRNPSSQSLGEDFYKCVQLWQSAFLATAGEKVEDLWSCVGMKSDDPAVPEAVKNFLSNQWQKLSPLVCTKVAEYKHLLLLPHHPVSSQLAIEQMMLEVQSLIRQILQRKNAPPLFITIARSVSDGYTNVDIADELQEKVQWMVRNVISEELREDFAIATHNLTEECIEKSFNIFHESDSRKNILTSVKYVVEKYYSQEVEMVDSR